MNWKQLTLADREALAEDVYTAISERLKVGYNEYGPNYQGVDPFDDLIEELLDAIIYLWWARNAFVDISEELEVLKEQFQELSRGDTENGRYI